MQPDDEDHDELASGIESSTGKGEDDGEGTYEGISARDSIVDADFDDDENETAAEMSESKKSGGAKFLAPVLVLALAAGAGAFIVLHPEIISGGKPAISAPHEADMAKANAGSDIKLAESDAPKDLPQPTATQNEAPTAQPAAAPAAPAADITEKSNTSSPAATPAAAASDQQPAPSTPPAESSSPAPLPGAAPTTQGASATPSPAPDAATPASTAAAETPAKPESIEPAASPTTDAPAAPAALSAQDEASAKPDASANHMNDIAQDMSKPATPAADKPAIPVDDAQAPQPDQSKLKTPSDNAAAASAHDDTSLPTMGESAGKPVAAKKAAGKSSDSYYDSDANLPSGEMANAAGPRKMDPNVQAAQKFVVVSGVRASSDPESVLVSANRALKLGRYDAALDMFNGLYAKNKRDPRILMGRAVAQQNLGQTEAAIDSYQALLKVDQDNTDAMVNMLGLLKSQNPSMALQHMLDLQASHPSNAGLNAQIGVTEGDMGNYADAMKYLGMAASLEPNNPLHPFNMAVLSDRQGQKDMAIKYYEQALQTASINPDAQAIPKDKIYDRLAILRQR